MLPDPPPPPQEAHSSASTAVQLSRAFRPISCTPRFSDSVVDRTFVKSGNTSIDRRPKLVMVSASGGLTQVGK